MSICMLFTYKVKFKQKRSYPDNSQEFENPPFITETSRWERTMTGPELLNFIMKTAKDEDMFQIYLDTHEAVIELFNPWNGSSCDITISWEEKDEYKDTKKH